MKRVKSLLFAVVATLVCSINAVAYDFVVDGIYYNIVSLSDFTCAVTQHPNRGYVGNIAIPSILTYNGKELKVVSIEKDAFYNCKDLKSIIVPNTVITIGSYAFCNCTGLKSVSIGNSVEYIYYRAFGDCVDLSDVKFEDGEKTIFLENGYYGGIFVECPQLKSIYLGRNVSNYSHSLINFGGITSLKTVTIGNLVTTMPSFSGCAGLTSVTIGTSVKNVEKNAFSGCRNIIEVNSLNPVPPILLSDFETTVYINAVLSVPGGAKGLYQVEDYWKNFWFINENISTKVERIQMNSCNLSVTTKNGYVIIDGIFDPQVELFDIKGQCIYRGNDTAIPVFKSGVFIAKINGKSYKIII
ncbi:MAG: leucine-rich repeat domain-containing protein [Bacteroidales bacterium]|nr:leucine-rich repeat domain-containing protein [Bacteroidales bacterium]